MKHISIRVAALAAMLMTATAHADVAQDNVFTDGMRKVVSTGGKCVRTKWRTANDACAPAPAPRPTPAARMVLDQRTVYFDFNKSDLTSESVAKLNALINAVRQSPDVRRAIIVGHTDDIGSNADNEKLSKARAAAVNGYLSSYLTIPTSVLMVEGKGESNPVTSCPKSMKRKQRIACLAADRRVEIQFDYVHYVQQ